MTHRSADILAFGAHPDDVEFGCAGTLLVLKGLGFSMKIIDLTPGDQSAYASPDKRREAKIAGVVLGFTREVLNF